MRVVQTVGGSGSGGHHGEPPPRKDAWWISRCIRWQVPALWFYSQEQGGRNQLGITYIKKSFNGRFQDALEKHVSARTGCSGDKAFRMGWAVTSAHTAQGESALTMCLSLEIQIIGGNEFDWLIWITL